MSSLDIMKKTPGRPRQGESLTRSRIVEASIELLNLSGAKGLTFLSERLARGPGAIYWHIADKSCELKWSMQRRGRTPNRRSRDRYNTGGDDPRYRTGLFDAVSVHPWVGSAWNERA